MMSQAPPPVQNMMCDSIRESLSSRCYAVDENYSLCPQLTFHPIHHTRQVPPPVDLINQATLMLLFRADRVELRSERPTSSKTIAEIPYEDPNMFEKLASVLAKFDIWLKV